MRLSELWLREWMDLKISSKELFHQMIMLGFEVKKIKSIDFTFHGLIVGKIIKIVPHPNHDKLNLIKVDIGNCVFLNVISSASNCRKGIKVPVAIEGTNIINFLEVRKKNIFGVDSEGLLCSYKKLAISNSSNLIELPKNSLIGKNVNEYLIIKDNIFEIDVHHNRGDCLSVLGISREISAINNVKLKMVNINLRNNQDRTIFPIFVKESKSCPRFLGRLIKNVNVNSLIPNWMKKKLYNVGLFSNNSVINIINYVLVELGQPIQVYDFDTLDSFIMVRMAKKGETVILLNNKKIVLESNTLVVADKKKILSIAGIMGSKRSSLRTSTVNIFLESAYFNPSLIIGKSSFYDVFTESSIRFERGVDYNIQYKSINRVTDLILGICGGKCGDIIDVTNEYYLPKLKKVKLTQKKFNRLVGYYISDKRINLIFKLLNFKFFFRKKFWEVIIPSWRYDINIEEDLIEEIIRIYGYNNIPKKSMSLNFTKKYNFKHNDLLNRIRYLLIDRGYNEVITYSFVDPNFQNLLFPNRKSVNLISPISSRMSVMRVSLIVGLLKTIIYNKNRQQNQFRLFEFGFRFFWNGNDIFQEFMLAGVISGERYIRNWIDKKREVDFYDIKGDVESILHLTGKLNFVKFQKCSSYIFHPVKNAKIYLYDNCIGEIGLIHPKIRNKMELKQEIFVFELKCSFISSSIDLKIETISQFPISKRDISVVVPEEVSFLDILSDLKKVDSDFLINIHLFDVYTGCKVKKGYKSFLISLSIQNKFNVLVEEEIEKIVSECILRLKKNFNGFLRE